MKKNKEPGKKKDRWIGKVVVVSIATSIFFTFISTEILGNMGYLPSFLLLLIFILLNVVFDTVGVAVTSAEEKPFHSMAAHKEQGAAEALRLIKNADRVSSVCNDVVGDISGIISGTTSAIIVTRLVTDFSWSNLFLQLVVSGLVAGATIGGKALGKNLAINRSTKIVLSVGKILHMGAGFRKREKK